MTIYIDADFKCHTSDDGTMDGVVFPGEMVAPWKDWRQLDEAQREYEREQLATLQAENEALVSDMAQMVEEIYQSDTEMMGL